MRISVLILVGALLTSGGPVLAETKTTYLPPTTYFAYDCPQLVREARALLTRSDKLAGVRQAPSSADAGNSNSTVIPWPKAFSIADEKIEDEVALMRGQLLALEEASIRGQCSIQFPRAPS